MQKKDEEESPNYINHTYSYDLTTDRIQGLYITIGSEARYSLHMIYTRVYAFLVANKNRYL